MKSKFLKIYSQYITEQDQPVLATGPTAKKPEDALEDRESFLDREDGSDNSEPSIDNQEPSSNVPPLDTSNFVTLVRLLKDAFVAIPSDEDADKIMEVGEVNAANVFDKFKAILGLIRKYNSSTDIESDLKKVL